MKLDKIIIVKYCMMVCLQCIFFFPKYVLSQQKNNEQSTLDTNALKHTLMNFIQKADSSQYQEIIPYYDTGFLSVRVIDEGQFIKMNYKQMVDFWNVQLNKQRAANSFTHPSVFSGKTTIYFMETSENMATIILTRIKDFGKGPETMFYDLTWISRNNKWYLFREFVHQRSMPSFQ